MMEQLEPLLRELAAQLGTTVEFLWAVLVRQAVITAWRDLALTVIYYPLAFYFGHWIWQWGRQSEDDDDWLIVVFSIIGIIIVSIIIFGGLTYTIPERLFNPEYWALQQILRQLK